jgi:hypothetical protein
VVARVRRRFAVTGIIGRKEQGGAPPVDCKAPIFQIPVEFDMMVRTEIPLNVRYPVEIPLQARW